MPDQATTLRSMAATAEQIHLKPLLNGARRAGAIYRARTIAITSGKGGVGKSNIAVNLALELAVRGHRVSLFDADCALANADVLLGLNPHYHLGHVISGQRTLEQVVIEAAHGLRLIPGGSGTEELANLSFEQHARLVNDLQALEQDSDFMIIDTAAGIAANVTGVLRAAMEVIIITTPDPTSVVDAYATIKVLLQHSPSKPIKVIVNDAVGISDADRIFAQLRAVTTRFLNHQIEHLGTIPCDPELGAAVREQIPVIEYAPDAPSSRALRLIARRLEKTQPGQLPAEKLGSSFWCALNGADV